MIEVRGVMWRRAADVLPTAAGVAVDGTARIAEGAWFNGTFGSIHIGAGVEIFPGVYIFGNGGILELGDRVRIFPHCFLSVGEGEIRVGDETHMAPHGAYYGHGGLRIGARCAFSAGVVVSTIHHDRSPGDPRPFVDRPTVRAPIGIGDNVWVAANAVVSAGARIAPSTVVGAGSVVIGMLDGGGFFTGAPARRHP